MKRRRGGLGLPHRPQERQGIQRLRDLPGAVVPHVGRPRRVGCVVVGRRQEVDATLQSLNTASSIWLRHWLQLFLCMCACAAGTLRHSNNNSSVKPKVTDTLPLIRVLDHKTVPLEGHTLPAQLARSQLSSTWRVLQHRPGQQGRHTGAPRRRWRCL